MEWEGNREGWVNGVGLAFREGFRRTATVEGHGGGLFVSIADLLLSLSCSPALSVSNQNGGKCAFEFGGNRDRQKERVKSPGFLRVPLGL